MVNSVCLTANTKHPPPPHLSPLPPEVDRLFSPQQLNVRACCTKAGLDLSQDLDIMNNMPTVHRPYSWDFFVFAQYTYILEHIFTTVYRLVRLVGLVVRRPPRERKIPGSNPACDAIFSGSSHTSDSKIGTPMVTLPGA